MARTPLHLTLAFVIVGAAPAAAEVGPIAVFAAEGTSHEAAIALRTALASSHQVLSVAQARDRLGELARAPLNLAAAEGAFKAASAGKMRPDEAVRELEAVVSKLERAPELTAEGYVLLRSARIEAARRHLGLAGPEELGGAETEAGQSARALLLGAVAAEPSLELDPARYPPKLRRLLQSAKTELSRRRRGSLSVSSAPPGATVLLEGRALGTTPLSLEKALPEGRYRLALDGEHGRSRTRVVDVGERPVQVEFDWALEAAVRPHEDGPRLASSLTEGSARELRERLDVDGLVVMEREGERLRATLYTARGETRVDAVTANRAGPDVAGELASGLFTSPIAPLAAEAEDEAGLSPWVLVGAGAGGALVTGLVAGGGLAALWWWDTDVKSRSLKVEVAR